MQRLQAITAFGLIRALLSGAGRTGYPENSPGKARSNRVDADALPGQLKQDLGLTDTHDRRHPPRRSLSAFDLARDAFLRRPL